MSNNFKSLITRAAYVLIGLIIGIFAYDQFDQTGIDGYKYVLRQHAITVQDTDSDVVTFSTQSADQSSDSLDQITQEKIVLEKNISEKVNNMAAIANTRSELETLLADNGLDADIRRELRSSIKQLEIQENQLQTELDDMNKQLLVIENQLETIYVDLQEYVDQAFDGIE